MVLVHLINLIKIFGLFFFPLENKQTTKKNPTKLDLYVAGGQDWEQTGPRKIHGERIVHRDTHCQCNTCQGERKSVKSGFNTATRPSALPGVPRDRLWHHNGAPLLPAWALILQRPLDCKPHTLAASPTDPGLYLSLKIFMKTISVLIFVIFHSHSFITDLTITVFLYRIIPSVPCLYD